MIYRQAIQYSKTRLVNHESTRRIIYIYICTHINLFINATDNHEQHTILGYENYWHAYWKVMVLTSNWLCFLFVVVCPKHGI